MAPTPKRNPTPADEQQTRLWSISMLAMTGVGKKKIGVGVSAYDLANRESGRAHRLTLTGHFDGDLPVGASFKRTSYGDFKTSRPVSFKDFNGIYMDMEKSRFNWSFEVTLRDGKLPTSAKLGSAKMDPSFWKNVPGKVTQRGITEIYYGDGRKVDPGGTLDIPGLPELDEEEPVPKGRVPQPNAIKIPSDVLFEFDSYQIATSYGSDKGQKARMVLIEAGAFISEKRKERLKDGGRFRIFVDGHTDSIGWHSYNQWLSERRAEAVAKWLVAEGYLPANEIIMKGFGETQPVEPNQLRGRDYPYGRERNRRVEIRIVD